ncbi:MAG: hypothetical protein AAGF86_19315 [Pseudomonadota bacterium]
MSACPHSLVVIVPAPLKATAVAMSSALGYTADPSVPLSPSGAEPATHYGLHTWAGTAFVAIMTGQVTPTMDGFTAQEVEDFRSAIIVSIDLPTSEEARAHFDLTIASLGIQMVQLSPI